MTTSPPDTSKGPADAGGTRIVSRWRRSMLRATLVSMPFFLVPVLLLGLNRLGVIDLSRQIAYERTLIANLLLYWAVAAIAITLFLERRVVRRRLLENRMQVALSLITGVFALALGELTLRIVDPSLKPGRFEMLASPVFHHRNAPNQRGYGMGDVLVETNEDGLRTPYARRDFLSYSQRILLLGDSFAFGLGVPGEAVVSRVLETELRSALGTDDLAVANGGVTSYSPLLEHIFFSRVGRHYEPTLTILMLDLSDIGDDFKYLQESRGESPSGRRFDLPEERASSSWFDSLALWRALAPIRWRLALPFEQLRGAAGIATTGGGYDYYDFRVEVGGVEESNRFFVLRHPLEVTRPHFETTLGFIRDVANEAQAAGSRFVLVVTPRYFHWSDRECPRNWEIQDFGYYQLDEPYEYEYLRFFEEASERVDFPIVSLLEAFESAETYPLVFEHDPHWNEAGHRLVGEAIATELRRRGLVGANPDLVTATDPDSPGANPSAARASDAAD